MVNHIALPIGCILCGKYVIKEILGQGGFGITYLAEDMTKKNDIAIKEYLPVGIIVRDEENKVVPVSTEQNAAFQYGKHQFLEEAKILSQLNGNPNIVPIYSYFEENNTAYTIMECIEGINLKQYLKTKGGKIDWREMLALIIPLMDALSEVHRYNIIHRDITLDNIMIQKNGNPILLDFGSARYSVGDRTRSLDIVLKNGYAPKEQYTRRGKQGPYTDVYSLGACMYILITGQKPPESLERIMEDELVMPSAFGISIPDYVEEAIVKALAIDSKDRFQNMEEFKKAIYRPEDLVESQVKEEQPVISEPPVIEEQPVIPEVLVKEEQPVIPEVPVIEEQPIIPEIPVMEEEPVVEVAGFKDKKSGRKGMIPIISIFAVLLLAVLLFFLLTTKVPDATGSTLSDAEAMLEKAKLQEGEISYEYNDEVETDVVISMDKEGKRVLKKKTINLVVSKGKTPVTLEDYKGMDQETAVASIEENSLLADITEAYSNKVEAGYVISQEPEKDEILLHGDSVKLVISKGKEPKKLADYKNKTAETAQKEAKKKFGLKIKLVEKNSDKVEEGKIISQEPAAGSTVYYGDELTLTVSKGPKMYEVPDLSGKTKSQAATALEKQNLVLGDVHQDYSNYVAEGEVISQGIDPGQMRKKGTTVSITISLGKRPVRDSGGSSGGGSKGGSTGGSRGGSSDSDATFQ